MKLSVVTPLWQDRPAEENIEVARSADALGFKELWIGEMATYDAFAFATSAAHLTDNIALTIGPLSVSVRSPMTIAMGLASVANLTKRQVNLALGTSSTVVVNEWHGKKRLRTARHLSETAEIVRGLLEGEKVNFDGEMASCTGYRLRLPAPKSSIAIAAFGPAAVKVAARQADRMLLNMVTPESLRQLRSQMEAAANAQDTIPPSLAVWLPCSVSPTREDLDQMKRGIIGYLAAPGYSEMMAAAGFEELVKFALTRPHPKTLLEKMPDELLEAIGLIGEQTAVAEQIARYEKAGADEICLVPATAGDTNGERSLTALREITPE